MISDGVKDTSLKTKAKTKDFKIVLEDSNTGKHRIKCFGEAPNTLHIYSVIGNGQNSKLLPLKFFVQNMQCLVKSVFSSFSKDLNHEAKAKDSTLKAKAKTKDFKIVLNEPRGRGLVLEDSNTAKDTCQSLPFSRLGILYYFTLTESHKTKTKSLLSKFPGDFTFPGVVGIPLPESCLHNHCQV